MTLPTDIDHEATFISGVDGNGTVAAQSFSTWNGDYPATYGTSSAAFKWAANSASHTAGTAGGTVTYYVDPATIGSSTTNAMIDATLKLWSDEANIQFVRVSDPKAANFKVEGTPVGQYADAETSVVLTTAGSSKLGSVSGQSTLNLTGSATFNGNVAQEAQSLAVLIHEEGHIIGFGHSGAYDGDSTVTQLTADDSVQYSVMSYVNGSEQAQWGKTLLSSTTNADGSVTSTYEVAAPQTPMMLDILAAQRLYGKPVNTALSGGQTFGFNCNITDATKVFFDFSQNTHPVVTLYDAGTGNTLDLSGFSAGATVNLAQGAFTSANGETNNIGISYGTVITTAIGGAGNDFFCVGGSDGTQQFDGGGGVNFVGTATAAGSGRVDVSMKDGTVAKGGALDATFKNILGLQLGGDEAHVLGLSSGVGLIYGGSGALTFTGEGATDYVQGSTGTNQLFGGAGNEIFFSNGGADTMVGGSAANFMAAGHTASSSDLFTGTSGNDFVYGGAGTTHLIGGSGTEFLGGGSGSNTLDGGSGQNIFAGGSGTDVFNGGSGTNLMFEATGNDTFNGSSGTDYIYGGSGTSHIHGGSGMDVITTGAGNQNITAGSGHIVFNDLGTNQAAGRFDAIDNFSGGHGTDIYMSHSALGATQFIAANGGTAVLTAVSGGTAEIFVSNTAIAAVQSHIHFSL